ncbi:RHS repeat-associated core domain-containing protein [Lysobacter firmicutimachus]|uniref:RHS repeat-associated core domain-containing protein n=1 Tax=Lysobacter firmicutimachus TaxID=1792846 RepID=A0ABU8CYL4_9GAMM
MTAVNRYHPLTAGLAAALACLHPSAALAAFPPETGQAMFPAPPLTWAGAGPTYTYRDAMKKCKRHRAEVLEEAASRPIDPRGFNQTIRVHTNCQKAMIETVAPLTSVHLEVGNRFDLPPNIEPPYRTNYSYWYGSANSYWPLKADEEDIGKNLGCSDCSNNPVGNPIVINAQNKFQDEVDYAGTGGRGLSFHRYYNSAPEVLTVGLGENWRHTYSRSLEFRDMSADAKIATIHRDDGRQLVFKKVGGLWTASSEVQVVLRPILEAGVPVMWELENPADGSTETYDAQGRLMAVDYLDGYHLTLTYTGGLLSQVADAQGRSLVIAHNGDGFISSVTDPDGVRYDYTYGSPLFPTLPEFKERRLERVLSPTGYKRDYRYYAGTEPFQFGLLTQILDETGAVKATFGYDNAGNPVSTEHTGGAERYVIEGNDVVYANGLRMKYRFTTINGRKLVTDKQRVCTTDSCSESAVFTYDANGYPDVVNDFGGKTDFDYNAKGQIVQRIDAPGSNYERKTQTDWHPVFDLPTEERVYDRSGSLWSKLQWTYNARGQELTTTRTDPATGETRTTSAVYCESSDVQAGTCPIAGQIIRVNGPRTDVSDISTFSYYALDDAGCATAGGSCTHRKGDVWKETNALGHVTEYLRYDRSGRAVSVKDATGVIAEVEYDPRGRLLRQIVRGSNAAVETDDAITLMEYDVAGRLKKTTDPDGVYTRFDYDAAGRVTDIYNSKGDRIQYTLDNEGRPEKTDVKDSAGTITRTLTTLRNQLGWINAVKDAYGRTTKTSYWKNGTPNYTTDALGTQSVQQTDELNRPSATLLNVNNPPSNGSRYNYDTGGGLAIVSDALSRETAYSRNRFGDLLSLTSPATGTTTNTYDSAGNLTSSTDAAGRTSVFAYDALGRKLTSSYPADAALTVTHTYDTAPAACAADERFTVGQLVRTVDGSGSTEYCYNRYGRISRKVQIINGKTFVSRYEYSKAGRLLAMTYPSGMRVAYAASGTGDVGSVVVTRPGQASENLLSSITYYPFGPAGKLTFGNGRALNRTMNLNYQPTSIQDSAADGLSLGFEFNEVGNLISLRSGNLSNPPVRKYEYDTLNQLTAVKNGADNAPLKTYIYNAFTRNRMTEVTNGATSTTSFYASDTDRLMQWGGVARTYDATGNTISNAGTALEWVYNAAGRMSEVKVNGVSVMTYRYSGNGERVQRQDGVAIDYTTYDTVGRFMGRYDAAGIASQEVIWLGDAPIGIVAGGKLLYVQADHLGTPRTIIDPVRQKAVWKWDLTGDVFGGSLPNQDPDLDGQTFIFDLRFAGQQFDSISGTHYNLHRDYDPSSGRYLQSDPIGLFGGMNTYNYVTSSPLMWADPMGLLQWTRLPHQTLPGNLDNLDTTYNYPGAKGSEVGSGLMGRTTIDWTVDSPCKCQDGQYFLNEYDVKVGAVINLRRNLVDNKQRSQTKREELQHVNDINDWIDGARAGAEAVEGSQLGSAFATEQECVNAAKNKMVEFLTAGAKQVIWESWNRYDRTKRHVFYNRSK